jgi:CRP-like cAMP-binding protein
MKTIADLLVAHPLFGDLDKAHRDLVAGCGRNRTFEDGTLLMKEGDSANEFFAIRKGKVAICLHVPERGEVVIETLDAGDVVGWSWLFPPHVSRFDARAVGDTHVIAFDGACLRTKSDADPALGYALMKRFAKVMTDRLQATQVQLLDVYGLVR